MFLKNDRSVCNLDCCWDAHSEYYYLIFALYLHCRSNSFFKNLFQHLDQVWKILLKTSQCTMVQTRELVLSRGFLWTKMNTKTLLSYMNCYTCPTPIRWLTGPSPACHLQPHFWTRRSLCKRRKWSCETQALKWTPSLPLHAHDVPYTLLLSPSSLPGSDSRGHTEKGQWQGTQLEGLGC